MPLGKLYALYDAKWIFIIATIVFMAASALCGAAPNMTAEIIGRVIAGAGGNAMYFGLLNLISVHALENERPTYLSLTGMVWGLGTVLGPVVGGAFVLYTWRWAFYINLLFAIFQVPAYFFLIPSTVPAAAVGSTRWERARGIDWIGALLSCAAFVLLIIPINFGGVQFDWNSGATIGLFVASGVLWILFAIQQRFCVFTNETSRMFPVHLLKQKETILLFIVTACCASIIYPAVYYIPLYFQFTRADTAIKTAERMLPLIILLITMILSSGYLMGKVGYYKPWYVIGSALALIGSVLYSRIDTRSSLGANYGYQILIGFGSGAFSQASFAVIQAVVDAKDAADGVTFILIAQLSGLCLGLSVAGAIFINTSESGLHAALPSIPFEQVQQIVAGTSGDVIRSLSEVDRSTALNVIVGSIQKVFTEIYVAAALSFIVSLFLSNRKTWLPIAAGGG